MALVAGTVTPQTDTPVENVDGFIKATRELDFDTPGYGDRVRSLLGSFQSVEFSVRGRFMALLHLMTALEKDVDGLFAPHHNARSWTETSCADSIMCLMDNALQPLIGPSPTKVLTAPVLSSSRETLVSHTARLNARVMDVLRTANAHTSSPVIEARPTQAGDRELLLPPIANALTWSVDFSERLKSIDK